eukprot:gene39883-52645_t
MSSKSHQYNPSSSAGERSAWYSGKSNLESNNEDDLSVSSSGSSSDNNIRNHKLLTVDISDIHQKRSIPNPMSRMTSLYITRNSPNNYYALQEFQSSFPLQLRENFRYYRSECMEAAVAAGVTVPLDMLEDKSGLLLTFIEQR